MSYDSSKVTGNVELTDDQLSELQNQVGIYYNYAVGYQQGELGVRARIGWDYYYGHLPEPITTGSSNYVDRTVFETVNGVLQELISVFTSDESAVRFSPIDTQDAYGAIASTKMVNKVLLRDNPGYNVLHDAFKECLVTRNSFVKRYWGVDKQTFTETFEDFTKEELDVYLSQIDGEIISFTSEEVINLSGESQAEGVLAPQEEGLSGKYFGEVTYEKINEGVKVEFVPFEFLLVEPTATCLKDSNYIAQRARKSKDELLDMGFSEECVVGINPASSDIEAGVVANARINNLSPLNVSDVLSTGDEKADKLWLHENYIKTSILGHLEILQVFTLHNQIIEVNRVNEFPFETFTPLPIPGSIWGESIVDITKDIQDLKTSIIRGYIDNIMNANFRRYKAIKGAYDRQSLLNNRPGGVVEMGQLDAVVPFEHHQLPNGIDGLLGMIDMTKEQRTGVTRLGQGLDPNVFKNDNSTATVNTMLSASQNRLRMIARNIAHRGIMELMASIHELIRQNGKEPILIDTANGPVEINPRTLPKRDKLIVSVAIGDSERKERAANLQAVMMMFNSVPQMTQFFQPQNAYFLATQTMEAMGIYDVENFITPPAQIPPPQPSPAEQIQLAMLQEQLKGLQVNNQKVVSDVQNETAKMDFEQMKAADEVQMKREESMSKQDQLADQMNMELRRLQLEMERIQVERERLELKRQELNLEASIEINQDRAVGLGKS